MVITERNVFFQMENKKLTLRYEGDAFKDSSINEKVLKRLITITLEVFFSKSLENEIPESNYYLPAARTGLMKSSNFYIDRIFEQFDSTDLNISEQDFLIKYIRKENIIIDDIATYIEDEILKGRVDLGKDTNSIKYTSGGKVIPKHLYSSAVTELLPLIVFLKKGLLSKGSFLVIEEPEAHLSLKNQQLIAKVIAKLVKRGVKVLITTHSDYLVYVISNLIKCGTIKEKLDKKETGRLNSRELKKAESFIKNYEDFALSHDKVNAYNFKFRTKSKSIISEQIVDEYGIHNKYFDDLTIEIVKKNDALIEILDKLNADNPE